MSGMPDDAATWVDYALEDLEMARRAMTQPRSMPRAACFHAQQCAEKLLKAYLVFRRASFPRVHDLEYLLRLCVEFDPGFETLSEACDVLNEYGVPIRYPREAAPAAGDVEGRDALDTAERVL
jgi:HEPN domain-containing protein